MKKTGIALAAVFAAGIASGAWHESHRKRLHLNLGNYLELCMENNLGMTNDVMLGVKDYDDLTATDIAVLSRLVGMTPAQFKNRYCERY